MRNLILALSLFVGGCATRSICVNSNEGFRSILDPERSCAVRIRHVIVGADLDLPKSISFKSSDVQWSYKWVESSFKDGSLELGHFVLVPIGKGSLN